MNEKKIPTLEDMMAELLLSATFAQNGLSIRQQAEACQEGYESGVNPCTQYHPWCAGCDLWDRGEA